MDAITLLKNDHREVEDLFRRFEKAGSGAHVERRDIVERVIEALSRHAAIEEQIFYPVTRATVPAVEDVSLESIEEHNLVKILLADLSRMDPDHERFEPKVTVLMELVRHHVEEEEEEYFPEVDDELGDEALEELGTSMEELKERAPTRPHPELPDSPPANALLAPAAAVVDRVSDVLSGSAQGAFAGLEDVIERVSGAKVRRSSPRGSTTAKRQARRVRAGADSIVDAAEDAIDDVRSRARKATTKASRSTKRTARSTRSRAAKATKKATKKASKAAKAASNAASTARKVGSTTAKASAKKATASAKKSTANRSSAKKASAKKASAKKATAKKATAKKASAKKATAKKASAKKATAKKATAKKATAKKAGSRSRR